jgi:hypothetical protein
LDNDTKDIISLSIGNSYRFFHSDLIRFRSLFDDPSTIVNDSTDSSGINYSLQLAIRYGLDDFIIPGISIGSRLDYAPTTFDIDLSALQSGNEIFRFNGNFLTIHNIAVIPFVEFRSFMLIEYFSDIDLPPYLEVSITAGPRINFNFFEEGNIDLEDEKVFDIAWEATIDFEIFLSSAWSIRLEYGIYDNQSDFEIVSQDLRLFSGELDLQSSRIGLEIMYYF